MSMMRLRVVIALVAICSFTLGPSPAQALTPTPPGCVTGTLPHGALSLICVPASGWNGDLIVFAHGYVAPNQPLDFYNIDQLGGISLPLVAQLAGFAFATTSYRSNGLVVLEGVDDVRELIAAVPPVAGRQPTRTFMTGVSDGGLVATLLVERSPGLVTAGLAACGPIGDFRAQINYIWDFRVLFDYFYPGVLPGSPNTIPQVLIDGWDTIYRPAVINALIANPTAGFELLRTAGVPIDPVNPGASGVASVVDILWYNVFATNNAKLKLGGNPYDNVSRTYQGSSNDTLLNQQVARFSADPAAVAALVPYQTSANPSKRLVTLHTTSDDIVPFGHEILYYLRSLNTQPSQFVPLIINRHGHCTFTLNEVLAALGVVVAPSTGTQGRPR